VSLTTDAAVNRATWKLFGRFPDAHSRSQAVVIQNHASWRRIPREPSGTQRVKRLSLRIDRHSPWEKVLSLWIDVHTLREKGLSFRIDRHSLRDIVLSFCLTSITNSH